MKLKKNIYFKLIIVFVVIFSITLLGMLLKNVILKKEINTNPIIGTDKMLAVNTASWDTNKVTMYTDSNGVTVPIPKGYVVSSVSSENVVKTGLVIYEGTASVTLAPTSGSSVLSSAQATRNQWVWVPVPDVSRIYSETNGVKISKLWNMTSSGRTALANSNLEPGFIVGYDTENNFPRYDLQSLNRHKFYQEIQIEFEETIKSIQKYGGFYIGRYETGNLSKKTPVIRKMNNDIASQNWYNMYSKSKFLGVTVNVKSYMIFGSLWDETLQWLVDSGAKTYNDIAVNSKSWGNYVDSSFTYTNTSGSTSTKSLNSYMSLPAGCTEYTKANNIYDLAGNLFDWTLEESLYGAHRCLRGGYFANDAGNLHRPANDRNAAFSTTPYGNVGYRSYLYIK